MRSELTRCVIGLRQRNPRRQGDLGEAAAIQWLAEVGGTVCFPLFHSPDFDLVAEVNGSLLKIQVKTSTQQSGDRFKVQLATSGGNRSWSGLVKRFSSARCDFLFVLVADGRRWFIPAQEIEAATTIVLGGPKYAEFEIREGEAGPTPSTIGARRGSAGAGEPGRSVKSVPRAEWVRFPPPPLTPASSAAPAIESSRASARTRISANHQLTIPRAPFDAADLRVGDNFRVDALGNGQVLLTRAEELADRYSEALFEGG